MKFYSNILIDFKIQSSMMKNFKDKEKFFCECKFSFVWVDWYKLSTLKTMFKRLVLCLRLESCMPSSNWHLKKILHLWNLPIFMLSLRIAYRRIFSHNFTFYINFATVTTQLLEVYTCWQFFSLIKERINNMKINIWSWNWNF